MTTAALAMAGCFARSVPMDPPAEAATGTCCDDGDRALVLSATAGLSVVEYEPNVPQLLPLSVAEDLAEVLATKGVFDQLVFPMSALAAATPPITLELSVASSFDFHRWNNLLRDLVTGASLLLLQPVLPTRYDLNLALTLVVVGDDGRSLWRGQELVRSRFEYNWLHPPEEALDIWIRDTRARAVTGLVGRLDAKRSELRQLSGVDERRWAKGR